METIPISKFKAICLSLLQRLYDTGQKVIVTKNGKPIAMVGPPPPLREKKRCFGCMANSVEIKGSLVEPLGVNDWDALK